MFSIYLVIVSFAVAVAADFDSSWPTCPAEVFPKTIACNPEYSTLDCVCPLRDQRQWGDILLLRMVDQCGTNDTQSFLDVASTKCASWSATATFALVPSTVTVTPWPTVVTTKVTQPATTETVTSTSEAPAETMTEELTTLMTTSIAKSSASPTGTSAALGNHTVTSGAAAPTASVIVNSNSGAERLVCWSLFGSALAGSVAFAVFVGIL